VFIAFLHFIIHCVYIIHGGTNLVGHFMVHMGVTGWDWCGLTYIHMDVCVIRIIIDFIACIFIVFLLYFIVYFIILLLKHVAFIHCFVFIASFHCVALHVGHIRSKHHSDWAYNLAICTAAL
jgi:hypothetical protein